MFRLITTTTTKLSFNFHLQLVTIIIIVLSLSINEVMSFGLDLCDNNSLVNANLTSYRYKNETQHNCNCTNIAKCFRKCCASGFSIVSKGVCGRRQRENIAFKVPIYRATSDPVFLYELLLNDDNISSSERFAFGTPNQCYFFPYEVDLWRLIDDTQGKLWTKDYGYIDNTRYCVDLRENGEHEDLMAFVCFVDEDLGQVLSRQFNTIGMIISMPFLLATFFAYALVPDRNLHMKALMSYVINLFFGYLFLVIIQLSQTKFETFICSAIGYLCIFFFLVSFYWMNVICIDIWFAFSGLRGFSGTKNGERKRFLIYCAYTWSMSILHVLVVLIIDRASDPTTWFFPGIGEGQCFIKTGFPELLYFYGPMAVLISLNIVFFTLTAIKIRRIKKDTSMLKKNDSNRHTYENDKQKFNLYLKLLLAMGVNWSLEIISWAVNWYVGSVPPYVWYLTDFCNAIYGVFIFFIFVFKKSIWKLLKKRYYSFMGRTYVAHSLNQNQTRMTSLSTNSTSVPDTNHSSVAATAAHVTDSTILTSAA